VLVVAAGVPRVFEDLDFSIAVIGYVIMRIALVAQWLRAAREDPVHRRVAMRFALGIALVQLGWVLRLALGPPEIGTLAIVVLLLAELAIPIWAERTGPVTPWNPDHIVERYGLFTIIVLGECILATMTATQTAFDAGGALGPLLTVAVGGLVLVFAMWWSYFKHDPDISRSRSLRSMIAWGYGHYVIFAAVAALGAGLQVAADTTHDATELTPSGAALTVAVPVAIYLVAVAFIHARRTAVVLAPIAVVSVLLIAAALAATWIGVPAAVLVMAILVSVLLAVNLVTMERLPA
jgi:low temperature requirement protein LtrA